MSQFFKAGSGGGGSGDVVGPASSTDQDIAIFSGTTGKLLADSGIGIGNVLTKTGNLGGLANVATARSNLGLGSAALLSDPITETHGGTNQTAYNAGDILYSSASNTLSRLPISSLAGTNLIALDTGLPSWDIIPGIVDAPMLVDDDFCYVSSSANVPYPWYYPSNGATGASAENGTPEPGHPGVKTLTTGTDTNGEITMVHGSSEESTNGNCILGGGVHVLGFVLNLPDLSTVSDEYSLWFGLGSGLQAYLTHPGDYACVFRYQRTSSTNWQGIARSAGSQTIASGGSNVAVSTGWNNFIIVINAAATSVSFYVNGTLIGTSTTNIPTSAVNPISLGLAIQKSAGTNARVVNVDKIRWYNRLTTPRF